MSNIEFLVDRIESNGLIVGRNGHTSVPVGTIFTSIGKTRVDGEPPDLSTIDLGHMASVRLTLKEVHIWRTTVPEIPSGYSAGLRLEGDGLENLLEAISQQQAREFVQLRA
jgi:hypothetical protein